MIRSYSLGHKAKTPNKSYRQKNECLRNRFFVVHKDIILEEKNKGNKIKLIGKVYRENHKIKAYVRTKAINSEHPLYFVDNKNKGVYYKTDTLGDLSIIGGASGTINAAASILRDIINLKY